MKKQTLFVASAILALLLASCGKNDYSSFIGTWGVEKIEYYNIDYLGNPIAASLSTYTYDPNDIDNGIQLIFREDKSGEMRDSARDTIWIEDEETGEYTYIYCPDTTIVTNFTYSYDSDESILYMNMQYQDLLKTFSMHIEELASDAFIYENEYRIDYMEKAYMKRLSKTPTKSASRQMSKHPHMQGSFLGDK